MLGRKPRAVPAPSPAQQLAQAAHVSRHWDAWNTTNAAHTGAMAATRSVTHQVWQQQRRAMPPTKAVPIRKAAATGANFPEIFMDNDHRGLGVLLKNKDTARGYRDTIYTPGDEVTDAVVKAFNSAAGKLMMRRNKEMRFTVYEKTYLSPLSVEEEAGVEERTGGISRIAVKVEYTRSTPKPSPDFEGEEVVFFVVAGGSSGGITEYNASFVNMEVVEPIDYWRAQIGLPSEA
jgi:hypothetical protein